MAHPLAKNTVQVLPEGELEKKLESGKKLKIKLGMDPTSPDLHLGHAVVLSKLKEFQDAGHEVIFLIGDFTARIGDPTGRSKTRPPLTDEEIKRNTQTYFDQVSKILDPKKVTVRYNSELLEPLTSKDMVQLCAKVTLARLTEREDFKNRIEANQPIGFHELLYPLFQGYDSVALKADVELGGTDQTFNLLMGRFLQEQYNQPAQVVMTMPILEGLDGQQKMSKSLGNTIGLTESPDQAFGKLMSISDVLMWRYMRILLNKDQQEMSIMEERVAGGTLHPMELKKNMARDIVAKFWSPAEADAALAQFEAVFQKKDYSQAQEVSLDGVANPILIIDLLRALDAVKTSSEARRLIEGNAVRIDDELIADFKAQVHWKSGTTIKVGKHRIYRVS
jgi:tyrosyl-tRNA synthetase